MRTAKPFSLLVLLAVLLAVAISAACSAPAVVFSPASPKTIAAGENITLPPIVIQNASGVSQIELYVSVPTGFSVDQTMNGGSLACVAPGSGSSSSLFLSDWNSGTSSIEIACPVNSGSTLTIINGITVTAPSDWSSSSTAQIVLSGVVTGGSGTATFGSLTLRADEDVSFSVPPAVTPSTANPGDRVNCSATAVDNWGGSVTYSWSDGGAGGTFSSANIANPTYIAPANSTTSAKTVTLTCTARSASAPSVTESSTTTLSVNPRKSIQVSSSPNAGAEITYTPAVTGATSPRAANFTLSYSESATNISLTASATDKNADHPRYFDHWVLDNAVQPSGTATVTINMAGTDHTAQAVYSRLVGDLNSDGKVDKSDADLILQKVLGDTVTSTAEWDVNSDNVIDSVDARWILQHTYAP